MRILLLALGLSMLIAGIGGGSMTKQKSEKNYMFSYLWRVIADDLYTPQEEYEFDKHLGRKHRFDFAFPQFKVAVEIEGNAWNVRGGGKHMQDRDLEKYNIAAVLGWRVLRFSPAMMKNDPEKCIQTVKNCIGYQERMDNRKE